MGTRGAANPRRGKPCPHRQPRSGRARAGVMNAVLLDAEAPGTRLDELLGRLPVRSSLAGDPSVRVRGVQHDSRSVAAGDLFVARKGRNVDAARFVDDAVARGAAAVMMTAGADVSLAPRVPFVFVDDV